MKSAVLFALALAACGAPRLTAPSNLVIDDPIASSFVAELVDQSDADAVRLRASFDAGSLHVFVPSAAYPDLVPTVAIALAGDDIHTCQVVIEEADGWLWFAGSCVRGHLRR